MEVINDILGYKNRKLYQDTDYFSFSLDSIMLANFATIRLKDSKILDLGTGNGVIPFIISLRTTKKIDGVEIQEKLYTLAMKSLKLNNLEEQISFYNMDMKDYCNINNCEKYDLIVCNPPYFKVNEKNYFNNSEEKIIARHEVKINLSDLLVVVKKLLKNNGNFAIVHRPERLLEILDEFRKNNIEPKRIRFVYETIEKGSTLVLIEGQKNGKAGLKIENPFIIRDSDGNNTLEYANLLLEVKK